MKLSIPNLYSQRDSRWSGLLLGFNTDLKFSIGNYGCLITAYGMYVDKTPSEMNEIIKDANGFTNGGLFLWSKSIAFGITQTYLSPRYDGPVTPQGLQKIKESLDAGFPAVCEIDFNPNTAGEEMHYVLLCGYEGDKIFAADPWVGQIIDLDVYGGPQRAILQFRLYDKTLQKDDGTTQIPVNTKVFENLVRKSTIEDKVVARLNVEDSEAIILGELDKLIGYEDAVIQKDRQLQDTTAKLASVQQELDFLKKEHAEFAAASTATIKGQEDRLENLSKELEALKKVVNWPILTGWKAILVAFIRRLP